MSPCSSSRKPAIHLRGRSSPWVRHSDGDRSRKSLTLELTPDRMLGLAARKVLNQAVRIGEAAKETGLSVDAIRFYEKEGLLKRSARTDGGFRLFGQREIDSLKFVRRAQKLGFSLQEIRELLFLQGDEIESCEHVRELLQQKVASVRGKIEELRKLQRSLGRALRQCKRVLQDTGPTHKGGCPVLRDLGTTKRASRRI
jgi:MerR family transcriptional regulator, mercuric resistance operon regulatory protein